MWCVCVCVCVCGVGGGGIPLLGMSGLQGLPSSFSNCTRTRPSTHHCLGYDLRCDRSSKRGQRPAVLHTRKVRSAHEDWLHCRKAAKVQLGARSESWQLTS